MSALTPPPLIDTHAHLQDPLYDDDLDEVLVRAQDAGLLATVCVGYDLHSSRRAVDLAQQHDFIFAAVGIHPTYAAQAVEAHWAEICELARAPRVVGLGETGLDNYRKHTLPHIQEAWFRRHLDLASEISLPVIVHNRDADERTRAMLMDFVGGFSHPRLPGVMHCFSSGPSMLESCLSLGFMISFAGPLTFRNADSVQSVARITPAEHLLVETDCPFLAPQPYRGERNEPAYLAYTARRLAELRGESFPELAERTTRTAARLFGLPIRPEAEVKAQ